MNKTREPGTRPEGLTEEEVARARAAHGENRLTRQPGKRFWRRFLSNLNDPVIRILLGALAIKLILLFREENRLETFGIAAAVFLATLISTLSEHTSERAFSRLSEESANITCRIRRGGTVRDLPIGEVVVGDRILLAAGDRIPADGYILSGDIRTDQSAMTGESREIRKHPGTPPSDDPTSPSSLFRGCTVTHGSCEMEVTAVGDATFLGGISREIQAEAPPSPLKLRLGKLARQISILGYIAAVLVAAAYLFNVFFLDSGMHWGVILLKLRDPSFLFSSLFHAFTLALTVIVVAVPEGLPMMIAVVLSSNIRKMLRDRVLVRKQTGIEAAGSMNILFTDKTGTLTEGRMKLVSFLPPDGGAPLPFRERVRREDRTSTLLALCFRQNNDACEGRDVRGNRAILGGSATEQALLEAVRALPSPSARILSRLPFDSERKYSAVTLSLPERITLVMGAPERLLPHTTEALSPGGTPIPLRKRAIEDCIHREAGSGGRVLAVCVTSGELRAEALAGGIRTPLSYLGAVTLRDPLRREAGQSVAALQDAGIRVVMITGDNRDTATALATRCGILCPGADLVLTGEELSRMSDAKLSALLPRLAVVARALPSDKSRLVRLSQEAGLVVGMTGDGINDAPALRRADIGFSMGSGTQVAKDAGDIIILDNNLASIVRAVLYGRGIFKSIRKFITLQLTMNFCAVGVTMICPFLGIDSPVTVVQMLWINIIMDTLGGLAFAGEPALPECMKEPPKRRNEPILNRYMINAIVLHGSFTVALCLYFLKSPTITAVFRSEPGNLCLLTAFFALFIFSSVFNCFNARTDRLKLTAGLSKNPVFLIIMLAILAIQIAFVYLGGSILRTMPLTARELLVTLALSLAVFPAELIRKLLWRLRGKKTGY